MSKQYLDVVGLSVHGASDELVRAAIHAYPDAVLIDGQDERLATLGRLRDGAGVQIITGPVGREFWTVAGQEVQVTVWPDSYDSEERWNEFVWAFTTAGGDLEEGLTLYSSHIQHGKLPTEKHRLYAPCVAAAWLMVELSIVSQLSEQIVVEDVPFSVTTLPHELRDATAIDFEWHRKTQELVGQAVSSLEDEADNVYVATLASDVEPDADRTNAVRRTFSDAVRAGTRMVGHGLRADLAVVYDGDPAELLADGPDAYRLDDTMGMAFILNEVQLGLKPLSRKFLGRDPIENDREWAEMPARMTGRYAAAGDTRNTADLFKVFDKQLVGTQRDIYEKMERPLVPLIASMEKYGVVVDIEATKREYRRFRAIQYGLRYAVRDLYGHDIGTPDGTRDFIEAQGFPRPEDLDQRNLALNPHWCIDLVLEHNMARTRANNFLKKILTRWNNAGRPAEFRLYTRFNQFARDDDTDKLAPGTGRLSSSAHKSPPPTGASGDNLQNQPRDIRDIYTCPKGNLWWSFDYDSLEIRIAAARSQDPEMLKSLLPGDPGLHTNFRNFILATTGRDVGRPAAKQGNFTLLYEGSVNPLISALAKQRSFIDVPTAQAIVDSHQKLFHVYHEWGRAQSEAAKNVGYAETYFGRRRYLPGLSSLDPTAQGEAARAAQNHPVQGTAADVIKLAMIRAQRVLSYYGGHLALQVHDELDGWVREHTQRDLDDFVRAMQDAMQTTIEGVTLSVAGGLGRTWGEAH